MSKKKTIAVAIILALVLIIGGMLAYFTDTDTRTNVFTLGDEVEISLSETGWTNSTETNYTLAAAQGVHPGTTVAKDPTINNESTTTPAYVFAEIIVPCYDADGDNTADTPLYKLLNSSDTALTMTQGSAGNSGWVLINAPSVDTSSDTITYVYAYASGTASGNMTSLAASASTTTPVFSKVQVDPNLTATQASGVSDPNITVNAYGIQTDGLSVTTPSDIYALF